MSMASLALYLVLASQVPARGIPQKDIPMFHAKKDISILFPYSVSQEE
jgi:hypothetical protein